MPYELLTAFTAAFNVAGWLMISIIAIIALFGLLTVLGAILGALTGPDDRRTP